MDADRNEPDSNWRDQLADHKRDAAAESIVSHAAVLNAGSRRPQMFGGFGQTFAKDHARFLVIVKSRQDAEPNVLRGVRDDPNDSFHSALIAEVHHVRDLRRAILAH